MKNKKVKIGILYSKTKLNQIYQWSIWTEGSEIHTEYGALNGQLQKAIVIATPKNIGKTNETTAEQQALLEAQAKYNFKLARKYATSLENAQQEEVFLPMLASDFEKQKTKIQYPVKIQPKLNGLRCLAFWEEIEGKQQVKLLSRAGKIYVLPHIQQILEKILPLNFVLDGELYIHDKSLQSINSLVKKWREGPNGSIKVQYHVYDGFEDPTESFNQRWQVITQTILNDLATSSCIKEVSTKTAISQKEVYEWQHKFLTKNYEGAIVRIPSMTYELGHRSRNLLKVKTFQDAEFLIVGHTLGVGKAANCVTWTCLQEDGKTFSVVPKGTLEEREYWANHALSFYGKKLTVKFFERTDANIPQFPIGLGFRIDEDLPL